MKNNFNHGFTLIELLVVIAIIGILSSVVLAALNTARAKGANAAVKSNLASVRTQAEIFYSLNGDSYKNSGTSVIMCADPIVVRALAGAANAGGATSVDSLIADAGGSLIVSCHTNASGGAYAVSGPLKVAEPGGILYWCVDSTGFAGGRQNILAALSPTCPGS